MSETTNSRTTSEKLAWEKPTLEVVAGTGDIASAVFIDDDEDFSGVPAPS